MKAKKNDYQITDEINIDTSVKTLSEKLYLKFKESTTNMLFEYYEIKEILNYSAKKLIEGRKGAYDELSNILMFIKNYEKTIKATNFCRIREDFFQLVYWYSEHKSYTVNVVAYCDYILECEMDVFNLFEYLFVTYETPIVLVNKFHKLNFNERIFLFDLLANEDVRFYSVLPFSLTKKEVHILKNFPLDIEIIDKHNSTFFWDVILATKCISKGAPINFINQILVHVPVFAHGSTKNTWIDWLFIIEKLIAFKFYESHYDLIEFVDYYRAKFQENEHYRCKKKSLKTIKRDIDIWHLSLPKGNLSKYVMLEWEKESKKETFVYNGKKFVVMKLINGRELNNEGRILQHCVISYAYLCYRGMCEIWSIRGEKSDFHFTVERNSHKTVNQVRGLRNRLPTKQEKEVLEFIFESLNWKF